MKFYGQPGRYVRGNHHRFFLNVLCQIFIFVLFPLAPVPNCLLSKTLPTYYLFMFDLGTDMITSGGLWARWV